MIYHEETHFTSIQETFTADYVSGKLQDVKIP